jgi:hypothetical protein
MKSGSSSSASLSNSSSRRQRSSLVPTLLLVTRKGLAGSAPGQETVGANVLAAGQVLCGQVGDGLQQELGPVVLCVRVPAGSIDIHAELHPDARPFETSGQAASSAKQIVPDDDGESAARISPSATAAFLPHAAPSRLVSPALLMSKGDSRIPQSKPLLDWSIFEEVPA